MIQTSWQGLVLFGALLCVSGAKSVAQQPSALEAAAAIETVLVETIAKAEKSVVAIAHEPPKLKPEPRRLDEDDAFGLRESGDKPGDPDYIPTHFATGVVMDRTGLILTRYEALLAGGIDAAELAANPDRFPYYVTTADRVAYEAKVKAADQRSGLAVLQLLEVDKNGNRVPLPKLTPITLGDAKSVRKGQIVITLGNPYAIARDGQASAGWGIVANVARKAGPLVDRKAAGGKSKPTLGHFGTLIQTDAKLNLGTNGGPLLNLKGEMIGLTTTAEVLVGFENSAGYAIPVDDLFRRAVETLKKGERIDYGFLGVSPANLTLLERQQGLRGVRIQRVIEGTPAAKSGLQGSDLDRRPGDIVTHVNDVPIYDVDGLMLNVGRLKPQDRVRLTVLRGGQPLRIETEVVKAKVDTRQIATHREPDWRGLWVDYPTAVLDLRRFARSVPEDCVAIAEVKKESPAWKAGLRAGMLASGVNDTPVRSPGAFNAAVSGKRGPVRITTVSRELGGMSEPTVITVPAAGP